MNGKIIFIDTSGFFALLDADDKFHHAAVEKWKFLFEENFELLTTDYIRIECWALLQRRLGRQATVSFHDDFLPICQIHNVSEVEFQEAAEQWRASGRKKLSLVDLTSFNCMRRFRVREALAFDKHFGEQGFLTAGSL